MYGKLKITADLHVLTGMHIGGSNEFSAIGAVDSPVIKDAITQQPIIPGSSLKGKLRTLMARNLSDSYRLKEPNEDPAEVARLFGTSKATEQNPKLLPTRLQFCDCFLKEENEKLLKEVGTTEVKYENTISRMCGIANLRQIERVIRGTIFDFCLVYDVMNEQEVKEDFQNLANGFKLLQMDYLGGHGTRGYGKVAFRNFAVQAIESCLDPNTVQELSEILKEVEDSEVLSV
jgi:CRISPR-associated protein Csm3